LLGSLGLEGAKDVGEFGLFGFVQEKVDVLGHEDVAVDLEAVALPELFEGLEEDCSCVIVVQVGMPVVATEGDEVVVAERVPTF